jgi:hypothetical protein
LLKIINKVKSASNTAVQKCQLGLNSTDINYLSSQFSTLKSSLISSYVSTSRKKRSGIDRICLESNLQKRDDLYLLFKSKSKSINKSIFKILFKHFKVTTLTCSYIISMSEAVSSISTSQLSTLSDIQNCINTIGSYSWSSAQLVILASLVKVIDYLF